MTNHITRIEDEHATLAKILNFRLPPIFMKVGLIGAIGLMIFLIVYKFMGYNSLLFKDVIRSVMLLFLLLASLSRDKVEDEYTRHLRFQSYVVAFVFATTYAIIIPLISIILDVLITNVSGDGAVSFYEISAFEVVFTLLGMQILVYYTLKKLGNC